MIKIGFKKISQTLFSLKQLSIDTAADLQLFFYLLKEKSYLLTTKREKTACSESALHN